MPVALAILLVIAGILLLIVLLDFCSPEASGRPLRIALHRLRERMDAVSYWIINVSAIALLLVGAAAALTQALR